MQRLNVGFSRAKEAIHLVLSKPIEQYRGSVSRVLQHYAALLAAGEPEPDQTDPASPMEAKVLDWIVKTQFYQANREQIELVPQFPVGDYLKQLDPYYQHPAYRTDFLLRFRAPDGVVNLNRSNTMASESTFWNTARYTAVTMAATIVRRTSSDK